MHEAGCSLVFVVLNLIVGFVYKVVSKLYIGVPSKINGDGDFGILILLALASLMLETSYRVGLEVGFGLFETPLEEAMNLDE